MVGLHARSHYRDGDIYFVYAGNPVPKSVVENVGATRRELPYAKAATRILPHYWSDYAGADEQQLADKDKDDGAYAVKSVTTPWWDRNDTPIFYFRYWYLWPFRYKESTYFLTWSQEGTNNIGTPSSGQSRSTRSPRCVFSRWFRCDIEETIANRGQSREMVRSTYPGDATIPQLRSHFVMVSCVVVAGRVRAPCYVGIEECPTSHMETLLGQSHAH